MVRANGAVSLRELARVVQTSEVTVRRDVRALEAEGLLDRRHGGAVLPGGFTRESGFPQKSHLATAEKTAIADVADEALCKTIFTAYQVLGLGEPPVCLGSNANAEAARCEIVISATSFLPARSPCTCWKR